MSTRVRRSTQLSLTAHPPPKFSSTIDRSKPYLRICIDYGTSTLSVYVQFIHDGQTIQSADVDPAFLKPYRVAEQEQITIYDMEGNLIYGGQSVSDYRSECADRSAAFNILRSVKMAAIPEFRDSRQVQHIRKVLGAARNDLYLQEYLTDHFKCILRDVKEWHVRQYPHHERATQAAYFDSLPKEFQQPVPVMMDDDGWATFRDAASRAGADEIEFREEPVCVAAFYVPKLAKDSHVKKGQYTLITDVGGLTCDLATCELLKAPSRTDSSIQMKRVGQCHGNGAGSNSLNDLMINWFLKPYNSYQIAVGWFDSDVKPKIYMVGSNYIFTFIAQSSHGRTGVEGLSYNHSFEFARTTILGFYDIWITRIEELLSAHLSTKKREHYACAILAGQPFRSAILKKRIAAFLDQNNIPVKEVEDAQFPCPKGGLRQHLFEKDTLPNPCSWYFSQNEAYDKSLHPDAASNPNLRLPSDYEPNSRVVHDRFTKVAFEYSALNGIAQKAPKRILQEVCVKCPEDIRQRRRDVLTIPLYWSQTKRKEHDPVYHANGKRFDGLQNYPATFEKPTPEDLEAKGFQKHVLQGQAPYYLVHAFVELQGDASGIAMRLIWMLPSFPGKQSKKAKKSGVPHMGFKLDQLWRTTEWQIPWTPTSSHFPNQFAASSGEQSRFDPHDDNPAVDPTSVNHPPRLGTAGIASDQTRGSYGSHQSHATRATPRGAETPSRPSASGEPTGAATPRSTAHSQNTHRPKPRARRETLAAELARTREAMQRSVIHEHSNNTDSEHNPRQPRKPEASESFQRNGTHAGLQSLKQTRQPRSNRVASKTTISPSTSGSSLHSPGTSLLYPARAPSLSRSVRPSTLPHPPKRKSSVAFPDSMLLLRELDSRSSSQLSQ